MDKTKLEGTFAGVLRKVTDTAKAAKTAVQDVAAAAKQNIAEEAKQLAERGKKAAAQTGAAALEPEAGAAQESWCIDAENALRIIYYLMAADGTISRSEEEKFDAIGAELDPNFAEGRAAILKDCQAQLKKGIDPEDYYDVLQDGVEEALLPQNQTADASIAPKLLLWDLLTVAYSDEHYDDAERKLLKYIVRKLQVDKAVFLEMESSLLTIRQLEKELTWIKTTDRPYLTIEARVNELTKRSRVIFDGVKDLIAL